MNAYTRSYFDAEHIADRKAHEEGGRWAVVQYLDSTNDFAVMPEAEAWELVDSDPEAAEIQYVGGPPA